MDPQPYAAPAVVRRTSVDDTLVGFTVGASDPPVCARFTPTPPAT